MVSPVLPNCVPMTHSAGASTCVSASWQQWIDSPARLLTDIFTELPMALRHTVRPIYEWAQAHQQPIAVRVHWMESAQGQRMPQFSLQRSTATPPSAPQPRGPSTLGLTVGLFGGSAAIVAFDHGLLQFLVDEGVMPAEARSPALFGTLWGTHQALYAAGLVETSPRAALLEMPTFFGFQLMAQGLLDFLGVELDPTATAFAGLTLAAMPYALARQSPMLANALNAARAGQGFQLAGLSSRAATLRVGAACARLLGWIGLADLGTRGLSDFVGWAFMDAEDEADFALFRYAQDIYNQEQHGDLVAGAVGTFVNSGQSIRSFFDSEVRTEYFADLREIQGQLFAGAENFEAGLNQSLLALVAQHIHLDSGTSLLAMRQEAHTMSAHELNWRIDWAGFIGSVYTFYQSDENRESIEQGYDLLDRTGIRDWVSWRRLIEAVNDEGVIENPAALQRHLWDAVNQLTLEAMFAIEEWAAEQGLVDEAGESLVLLSDQELSDEQRQAVRTEGLRLAVELVYLMQLSAALDPY